MAMFRSRGRTPSTGSPSMAIEPPSVSSRPGDGAQEGGLAAARGADEDAELALGDVEIDAAQGVDLAVVFLQTTDRQACHPLNP